MTERETPIIQACSAWRAILPVHPACEIIPAYEDSRLISLGREIKQTGGCKIPIIVLAQPDGTFVLLDGRSRLDSMCHVGIKFVIKVIDGHLVIDAPGYVIPALIEIVPDESFNAYAFVLSTNLHRRHLRNEQKRDIIKAVICAQPNLSDRAIARMAGVDNKTVAKLRLELKANEEILISREEATGRKARGRKPGQANAPAETPIGAKAENPGTGNDDPAVSGEARKAVYRAQEAAEHSNEDAAGGNGFDLAGATREHHDHDDGANLQEAVPATPLRPVPCPTGASVAADFNRLAHGEIAAFLANLSSKQRSKLEQHFRRDECDLTDLLSQCSALLVHSSPDNIQNVKIKIARARKLLPCPKGASSTNAPLDLGAFSRAIGITQLSSVS